MVELKRVLCAVDLGELSIRALAHAGAIAQWYGGGLTALHVVPTFEAQEVRAGTMFGSVQFVQPVPREQVVEQLQQALETAGVPSGAAVAAEAGDTATTIVEQAVALHADLLVMATHGRSGFDRLLLGSITEKVLRKAPCPVLTVPPHAPDSAAGVALDAVLCAVDFSPASLQALGLAVDLAQRADASLTVVQAVESLAEEEPRVTAPYDTEEFRAYLLHDAHERLDALIATQPAVARGIDVRVAAGRAYREVLRVADENGADLIVMGARGRGGPALTPLGSTTQQIVRTASCPVLTVRAAFVDE